MAGSIPFSPAPSSSAGTPSSCGRSSLQCDSHEQWLRQVRARKGSELDQLRGEAQLGVVMDTMTHLTEFEGDGELLTSYLKRLRVGHALEKQKREQLTEVVPKLRTIRDIPEDFVTQWVLSKSDLTMDDLKLARSHDSEIPWILTSHGSGLSMNTRLPADFQQLSCCLRFLDWCFARSTSRLADIKAGGIFEANGTFNWVNVVLKLEFEVDTGKLIEIMHVPSETPATLPAGFPISRDYEFHSFWSAQDAYAILKPMKKRTHSGVAAVPLTSTHPHRTSLGAICDNCGASQGMNTDTQHCGECGALQGADEEQEMEDCDALEAEQLFVQTRSQKVPAMNQKAKMLLDQKMAKRKLNFQG